MDIAESLDIVKREVEDIVGIGEELENQITYKLDELEALKEQSANVSADIQNYLTGLEGLQESITEFENVRDDASNYEIQV